MPSRSKVAGVLFAGLMMVGIVVNATLLQTGHVPAVAQAVEPEPQPVQQAALSTPASTPLAPAPVLPVPAVVASQPIPVDLTPTGSITPIRLHRPVKSAARRDLGKPTIAKAHVVTLSKHKVDGITTFLKGLGPAFR